jgi:hypothetical protein
LYLLHAAAIDADYFVCVCLQVCTGYGTIRRSITLQPLLAVNRVLLGALRGLTHVNLQNRGDSRDKFGTLEGRERKKIRGGDETER